MKLTLDKSRLIHNRQTIDEICFDKGIQVAYMIKRQFICDFIKKILYKEKVYTTGEDQDFINIYNGNNNIVIIDALDNREGISLFESEKLPLEIRQKSTAIVNTFCSSNHIPTECELSLVVKELYNQNFDKVSLGGSMLLYYDFNQYNEIRIGEALLTGYSTVYNEYFEKLVNPFIIKEKMIKCEPLGNFHNRVLINKGFLEVGGFTNAKVISCTTDFTILEIENRYCNRNENEVALAPDYFTLIKLADKGIFKDAEII